jgi:hypothetical protein
MKIIDGWIPFTRDLEPDVSTASVVV